jgi:predicted RNase H-like nuclease
VAVVLVDDLFNRAEVGASLGQIAHSLSDAEVLAVDMPIGISEAWPRQADVLARAFVGPRRNSVFMTPPRAVLEAVTVTEARDLMGRLTGQSISSQTYAIAKRILEADAVARNDARIYEIHPEVSFRELAGAPLRYAKSTWIGSHLRRQLLAQAGIRLPDDIGPAGIAGVADVLDAAIAAWSGARVAARTASSLPDPPQRTPDGLIAAIWV